MPSVSQSGDFSSSITPTSHNQVANYTITIPANTQVAVEFGTDTSYGRWTAPVPAPSGGGKVSILVAGMLASTQYHMRARDLSPAKRRKVERSLFGPAREPAAVEETRQEAVA